VVILWNKEPVDEWKLHSGLTLLGFCYCSSSDRRLEIISLTMAICIFILMKWIWFSWNLSSSESPNNFKFFAIFSQFGYVFWSFSKNYLDIYHFLHISVIHSWVWTIRRMQRSRKLPRHTHRVLSMEETARLDPVCAQIPVHCIPVTSILWGPEKNLLVTDICLYQVNWKYA
jgi:hypothetical protein